MVHLRPQAALGVLPALGPLQLARVLDLLELGRLLCNQVAQLALARHLRTLLQTRVTAISAERVFLAMQQLVRLRDIGDVCRKWMRSIVSSRYGCRPGCPDLGYCGSISASSSFHGTT